MKKRFRPLGNLICHGPVVRLCLKVAQYLFSESCSHIYLLLAVSSSKQKDERKRNFSHVFPNAGEMESIAYFNTIRPDSFHGCTNRQLWHGYWFCWQGTAFLVKTLSIFVGSHIKGMNLEDFWSQDGFTALHKAVIGKKEAVISHLLRKGANPHIRDRVRTFFLPGLCPIGIYAFLDNFSFL